MREEEKGLSVHHYEFMDLPLYVIVWIKLQMLNYMLSVIVCECYLS